MRFLRGRNIKNVMLFGGSLLVLSACLPDNQVLEKKQRAAFDAKANYYAQSFQNYSSRSLATLLASDTWSNTAISLNEGVLDENDDGNFANLRNGNAASYVQSAYCRDDTGINEYHMSWFTPRNGDGDLTLKGLGEGHGGTISKRINESLTSPGLAIYNSDAPGELNFINGNSINGQSTLTLSATCSDLDIPNGSAVVAYAIQRPTVANAETKEILTRTVACGANQNGFRVERIKVSINDASRPDILTLGDETSIQRNALMNHANSFLTLPDGEVISENCLSVQNIASRTIDTGNHTVDYLNYGLSETNGNLSDFDRTALALQKSLSDIDCKMVKTPKLDQDGDVLRDAQDNIIYEKSYGTCDDEPNENSEIKHKDLVTEEIETARVEEIITTGCGNRQTPRDISILGRNARFVERGAYSGEVTLLKTTKSYQNILKGSDEKNGNSGHNTEKIYQTITIKGQDISCTALDVAVVDCKKMFSETNRRSVSASGSAPRWETTTTVDKWSNPETPTPEPEKHSDWIYVPSSMNCTYTEKRTTTTGCPAGYTGSKELKQKRTAKVTDINGTVNWGSWKTTKTDDDCRRRQSSGSGDDSNGDSNDDEPGNRYKDTDDDGRGDSPVSHNDHGSDTSAARGGVTREGRERGLW